MRGSKMAFIVIVPISQILELAQHEVKVTTAFAAMC